ncbi:uncharacterized protein NECHADRAFT_53067 [Fusarium vanettenii 77-13-4]|uniref:Thiol-specific monooxygenase n=1 Tax=Fusarium vanettenii (strain ATCC MYA-4622 / CBS 123669 / FGSC 9596 / NRRL 45880 / 77-13-4) TaxID=660122 RepID=C7ZIK9_FUSV7|nr:uncharacterized protein NECHADRAFT_53067 [Fusarium vanettenii 77-13-4]EEU36042.1 hypothetical protein NECHADRAFT_53067 [Fusarium vanettenii 77-13-4]
MSPPKKLQVSRVAVIGAGASGLAALRYLLAEKKFTYVQAFEQRATPGGVWNYTSLAKEEKFHVPREHPSSHPDEAIKVEDGKRFEFITPVYEQLETNIPHTLMNFTDKKFPVGTPLFPSHETVLRYLKGYAEDVKSYIQFQSQVLDVRRLAGAWEIEVLDLRTDQVSRTEFDAVLVASGHFNDPYVPNIPGLVEFDQAHPGVVVHSKFYRRPDTYVGKKVIIVGNSASGIDLTAQLSRVAKLPVIISEKEDQVGLEPSLNTNSTVHLPEITKFQAEGRTVHFANGNMETEVDAVIFCTGFHYSYPFLQSLEPGIADPKGEYVKHLWENVLYTTDPTLAFLSVPQRGIPFPLVETQSAVISRIWSGRLIPPSEIEMESWVKEEHLRKGEGKPIHIINYPEDVEYMQRLYDLSATALRTPELGLENEGDGKRPPRWGSQQIWIRGKVGEIKQACRLAGDRRFNITSAEELGFLYEEPTNDAA